MTTTQGDISSGQPLDQPIQPEHQTQATTTSNYPDPALAKLEFTESYYARDDESLTLPKLHVTNRYHFDIYGVDAIWHNMYCGPRSDFLGFRKQYDASIEQLLQLVAKHVAEGLYGITSLTATKHSLTVVCECELMREAMPGDMWNDPVELRAYPRKRVAD